MCMSVLPVCMFVCRILAYLWRSEEGIGSYGTRVTGGCELPCRCEGPNPGPLQEQPLLLASETSLKPPRSEV